MAGENDGGRADIAERIRKAVTDALDSRDFGQLNRTIGDTVDSALDEARQQWQRAFGPRGQAVYDEPKKPPTVRVNWREKYVGILYSALGILGLVVFGPFALLLILAGLIALMSDGSYWVLTGIFAAFTAGSGVLLKSGISRCRRAGRLKKYLAEIRLNGKPYQEIRQLGAAGGYDEKFVREDMRKILAKGMLPDARMDDAGTYLILDDATYRQYLQAKESLRLRQQEARAGSGKDEYAGAGSRAGTGENEYAAAGADARAKSGEGTRTGTGENGTGGAARAKTGQERVKGWKARVSRGTDAAQAPEAGVGQDPSASVGQDLNADARQDPSADAAQAADPAVNAAIARGESYMEQLNLLRFSIPDADMTAKLERLDQVLERLFETLRKYPDQLDELEKFMGYYLPTTVKLVTAYQEFAAVEFPGENITRAKQEIRETMDTINGAFEKLLDDMYEDTAFDVMTDASVLQTMLAREGLTESDFKQ